MLAVSNRRTVGQVAGGPERALCRLHGRNHGTGSKGGGCPWLRSIGNHGGQGEVLDWAEPGPALFRPPRPTRFRPGHQGYRGSEVLGPRTFRRSVIPQIDQALASNGYGRPANVIAFGINRDRGRRNVCGTIKV